MTTTNETIRLANLLDDEELQAHIDRTLARWQKATDPATRIALEAVIAAGQREQRRREEEPGALREDAPRRYPLLSRIASGEQAKIDAEIDRFDRRNEVERPFVPAWRRREMERLERGESAGKDLGVAEDVPSYGTTHAPGECEDADCFVHSCDAIDADECATMRERSVAGISDEIPECFVHSVRRFESLSREELEDEIRKAEAREERTGGTADGSRMLDGLRDELDARGYRDDDYADGFALGHGDADRLLEENRSKTYYRGYEAGAEALAKEAIEQARDAAQRAREWEQERREAFEEEAREVEIARTARRMGVSPDEAARIREEREADLDVAWLERAENRGLDLPEHWGPKDIREARIRWEAREAARRESR